MPKTLVLFGKLVLFTVPVFFVLSAAGLYLVYSERLVVARDEFSMRIGNSVGRTAGSLERILAADRYDETMKAGAAQQMLLLLLGDQSIQCATLSRPGADEPELVAPIGLGCRFRDVDDWLTIDLAAPGWSTLRVGFSNDELTAIRQSQLRYSLIVLLGSLAASLLSSWVAFRVIVGKPLNALIDDLVSARDAADHASKAKTRFLANMSHEIRTPMNGIIGTAELLGDSKLDDRQRDSVRTITNSANALMTIIEDILDFAKIEAARLELNEDEFNLGDVIYGASDLVEPAATGKGIDLLVDHPGEERHAFLGDDIRLRQVLLNLLGNAIKFTPAGSVTLSVEVLPRESWSDVTFRVTDTGIGIAEEKLEAIFEPFGQASQSTTRQFGGTGLGLTISSELVTLMGGTLTARSKLGEGSVFEFTLPLRHGREIDKPAAVTALCELAQSRPVKVLAVDDLELNLRIIAARLAGWHVACDILLHPDEALERMMAAAEAGTPYDAAILDFDMPDVSGADLAALIRDEPAIAATPLILLSSVTVVTRVSRTADGPFDATLTKPLRPKTLAQALCAALGTGNLSNTETVETVPARADAVLAGTDMLVADDSDINRNVLAQQLAPTGASVRFAKNGAQAVESAVAHPPDIILMDLSMPIMNGFEAVKEIRARESREMRHPSLIFALSANVLPEHKAAAEKVGMDGFIAKPTRRKELIDAITAKWTPPDRSRTDGPPNTKPEHAPAGDATPGTADDALIDAEALADLKEMLGETKLSDLAAELAAQGDAALADIAAHIDEGDADAAAAAAHKLAGGAGSLGCIAMARALSTLEIDLKAGGQVDRVRLSELVRLWARTKVALPLASRAAAE